MERKAFHALLLSFALITGAVTISSDAHAQTNTERLITVVDNTNEANDILASILDAVTSGFANVLEMLGVIDDDLQTIHTDLEAVHDDLGTVHADLETVHADLETVHNDIESVNSAVTAISSTLGGSTTAFTQVNEQLTSISNMIDMIEVETPVDHSESIQTILADLEALKALLPEEEEPVITMEEVEEIMAVANMTTVLEQVREAATTTDAVSGGDLAAIIERVVMVAAEAAQEQADASVEDALADLREAQKNATAAEEAADKAKDEADEEKRKAESQIQSLTRDKLFAKTTNFDITVANLAELDKAPANNEYSTTHTLDCTQDVYLITADVEPHEGATAFSADPIAGEDSDAAYGTSSVSVTVDGSILYTNDYPPNTGEATDIILNLPHSFNYDRFAQSETKAITTTTNTHDVALGTDVTGGVGNAFTLDDYANRGTTDTLVNGLVLNNTAGDRVLFTGSVTWVSAFGNAECEIKPQRATTEAPPVSEDDPTLAVTLTRPALDGRSFQTGTEDIECTDGAAVIKQVTIEGVTTASTFFNLKITPVGGETTNLRVTDDSGYYTKVFDADERIRLTAADPTATLSAQMADENVLVTLTLTADTCGISPS